MYTPCINTVQVHEPRTLVETPEATQDIATEQQQPTVAAPTHLGAEEAILNAGLLRERPQLTPGDVDAISDYLVQPVQVLSRYPRSYHWPHFISEATAAKLVQLAEGHMRPSQLVLKDGDSEDNYKSVGQSKQSSSCFYHVCSHVIEYFCPKHICMAHCVHCHWLTNTEACGHQRVRFSQEIRIRCLRMWRTRFLPSLASLLTMGRCVKSSVGDVEMAGWQQMCSISCNVT